jgi:hypothetical protein
MRLPRISFGPFSEAMDELQKHLTQELQLRAEIDSRVSILQGEIAAIRSIVLMEEAKVHHAKTVFGAVTAAEHLQVAHKVVRE